MKFVMARNRSEVVRYQYENSNERIIEKIKVMLDLGDKIAAVKLWRDKYRCGLKEAKDAVEAIQALQENERLYMALEQTQHDDIYNHYEDPYPW